MAARERQRDKQHAITARRLSWPTIVLTGGVGLNLAANLAQAQPTTWGRIVAAVPSAAFLVAVSMIERRSRSPATRCAPGSASPTRPPPNAPLSPRRPGSPTRSRPRPLTSAAPAG